MKKFKLEIRLYIAELLLHLSFNISPGNNKDGRNLRESIIKYFESAMKVENLKS